MVAASSRLIQIRIISKAAIKAQVVSTSARPATTIVMHLNHKRLALKPKKASKTKAERLFRLPNR